MRVTTLARPGLSVAPIDVASRNLLQGWIESLSDVFVHFGGVVAAACSDRIVTGRARMTSHSPGLTLGQSIDGVCVLSCWPPFDN